MIVSKVKLHGRGKDKSNLAVFLTSRSVGIII